MYVKSGRVCVCVCVFLFLAAVGCVLLVCVQGVCCGLWGRVSIQDAPKHGLFSCLVETAGCLGSGCLLWRFFSMGHQSVAGGPLAIKRDPGVAPLGAEMVVDWFWLFLLV